MNQQQGQVTQGSFKNLDCLFQSHRRVNIVQYIGNVTFCVHTHVHVVVLPLDISTERSVTCALL